MPTAHHPDRWNFDEFAQSTYPHGGYAKAQAMPIGGWESVGAGSANITRALADTGTNDLLSLVFGASADATSIAAFGTVVPDDYDPRTDKLRILGRMRKEDLTGTDNADLALTCKMIVLRAGDSVPQAISGTSVVAPAKTSSDALANWTEFEFNFDGNDIQPGQPLQFNLSVNEAVGTDLALQLNSLRMQYRGSISFNDRDERSWTA